MAERVLRTGAADLPEWLVTLLEVVELVACAAVFLVLPLVAAVAQVVMGRA